VVLWFELRPHIKQVLYHLTFCFGFFWWYWGLNSGSLNSAQGRYPITWAMPQALFAFKVTCYFIITIIIIWEHWGLNSGPQAY
jgi:hypothetical protein